MPPDAETERLRERLQVFLQDLAISGHGCDGEALAQWARRAYPDLFPGVTENTSGRPEYDPQGAMVATLKAAARVRENNGRDGWLWYAPTRVLAELLTELGKDGWELHHVAPAAS